MKRKVLVWFKKPFLLVFWFFKRMICRLSPAGKKLMRRRKRIYETHISDLIKFKDKSPLDMVSAPPWKLKVSGACLVLSKYLALTVYNEARSYRWQEIYAFILGKRFGDLFIGTTFVPITNELRSATEATPDLSHVMELESVIASRYPELEIVCTLHSHPSSVLQYSEADRKCFLRDNHVNIIVAPRRLLWDSPVKRLAAYYHSSGKVRKIKIYETDKEEPDLKDIDIKELAPSKEELLNVGELATEIDFSIFKVWMVSHPNLSLKKLGQKLSELFGERIGFVFLYKEEEEWVYAPDLKVVDFFLKNGEHLIFPEFFGEVK